MYPEQVKEEPLELRLPRWLRRLGMHWFGAGAPKRCENCGGDMTLVDERVWSASEEAVYGARAWDCPQCEHQAESIYLVLWPSDT